MISTINSREFLKNRKSQKSKIDNHVEVVIEKEGISRHQKRDTMTSNGVELGIIQNIDEYDDGSYDDNIAHDCNAEDIMTLLCKSYTTFVEKGLRIDENRLALEANPMYCPWNDSVEWRCPDHDPSMHFEERRSFV